MRLFWATVAVTLPTPALTHNALGLGEGAFDFLYPLVIVNATMDSLFHTIPGFTTYNLLHHERTLESASDRRVVKPNVDSLYSTAYLDLTSDTVVAVHVPETNGRYYIAQFMDFWTNVFVSIGSRTTGTQAAEFYIVGPDYVGEINASMTRSPTRSVWLLLRTVCNGVADYPNVWRVQDGFKLHASTASSASAPAAASASMAARPGPWANVTPPDFVDSLEAPAFFQYAAEVINVGNFPAAADAPMVAKLATIGFIPGQPFNWEALPTGKQVELTRAVSSERSCLAARCRGVPGKQVNGWRYPQANHGNFSTDYGYRAELARHGLGTNLLADALYLSSNGTFEGAKPHTLRFEVGQLPPINAFWSLTVYDAEGYLVQNAEKRYALGDRSGLQAAEDGSTTIYLSSTSPDPLAPHANWLPTPAVGRYSLTLRLYWPGEAALSGAWLPPRVEESRTSDASELVLI